MANTWLKSEEVAVSGEWFQLSGATARIPMPTLLEVSMRIGCVPGRRPTRTRTLNPWSHTLGATRLLHLAISSDYSPVVHQCLTAIFLYAILYLHLLFNSLVNALEDYSLYPVRGIVSPLVLGAKKVIGA